MTDLPPISIPLNRAVMCPECRVVFEWNSQAGRVCPKCGGDSMFNLGRFLDQPIRFRSECWEWGAHISTEGYGVYNKNYVHRVTYSIFVGPIPEGLQVDHLCGNRKCCNPAHLEPVTQVENIRRGKMAKLSAADVAQIRQDFAQGAKRGDLAKRYLVNWSHISRICSKDIWKDDVRMDIIRRTG